MSPSCTMYVFPSCLYFPFALTSASVPSAARGEEMIREGECLLLLVAPSGFSEDLAAGEHIALQMLLDGSDSNTASVARGYLEAALTRFSASVRSDRLRESGMPETVAPISISRKVLHNPALESRQSIIPGLIVIILVILGALLTAGTVVREKERGTFETLAASPVRPAEVLLGKLLPFIVIGMADVVLAIGTGAAVFHVYIAGSVTLFLATSLVFLLAALAVGLLISTIAPREQVAMLAAILVTLLPALLLSGFVYPVRNMPLLLQGISKFIPATHFLTVIRGIYLKGVGLEVIWPQVLILVVIASALFVISVKRFRKQL